MENFWVRKSLTSFSVPFPQGSDGRLSIRNKDFIYLAVLLPFWSISATILSLCTSSSAFLSWWEFWLRICDGWGTDLPCSFLYLMLVHTIEWSPLWSQHFFSQTSFHFSIFHSIYDSVTGTMLVLFNFICVNYQIQHLLWYWSTFWEAEWIFELPWSKPLLTYSTPNSNKSQPVLVIFSLTHTKCISFPFYHLFCFLCISTHLCSPHFTFSTYVSEPCLSFAL